MKFMGIVAKKKGHSGSLHRYRRTLKKATLTHPPQIFSQKKTAAVIQYFKM
jgi:hypothetical protein